jgi:hypothetical protein
LLFAHSVAHKHGPYFVLFCSIEEIVIARNPGVIVTPHARAHSPLSRLLAPLTLLSSSIKSFASMLNCALCLSCPVAPHAQHPFAEQRKALQR